LCDTGNAASEQAKASETTEGCTCFFYHALHAAIAAVLLLVPADFVLLLLLQLSLPQLIHSLSTAYPQLIHSLSTAYPQLIHSLSTAYPQLIHSLSTML
jgi:hypothetical protein